MGKLLLNVEDLVCETIESVYSNYIGYTLVFKSGNYCRLTVMDNDIHLDNLMTVAELHGAGIITDKQRLEMEEIKREEHRREELEQLRKLKAKYE